MMRTRLISKWAAMGIGLGAAALLAVGPAAAQTPGGNHLTLSPSTVAPGGSVSITMGCTSQQSSPHATSPVFGTVTLQSASAGPSSHNYHGTAHVPRNARHGTHQVTSPCGSASLVVGPGGMGPRGGTGLDADNGALVAAGAGTLAAAAGGGFWLLRRRAAGAGVA